MRTRCSEKRRQGADVVLLTLGTVATSHACRCHQARQRGRLGWRCTGLSIRRDDFYREDSLQVACSYGRAATTNNETRHRISLPFGDGQRAQLRAVLEMAAAR